MSQPYIPRDNLTMKARRENFRARSVYKLEELDKKYKLLKQGMRVLDIGAAPGSWLQYTSKKIGDKGTVIGLDIKEIKPIALNVKTYVRDVTNLESIESILKTFGWKDVDLLLSDIAPSTTGIAEIDHGKSLELNHMVFEVSKKFLKPEGKLVMKVFEGKDFKQFLKLLETHYKKIIVTKSHASRERSKEMYIICQ